MSALGRVLGVAIALGMNPALAELHNESRRRAELRDERIRAEQLAARVRGDEVIDGAYLVDAAAEDADLPEPTQASAFWRHLSPFVDAPHGVILDVPAVLMPGQRTVAKLRESVRDASPVAALSPCCRDAFERRLRYCRSGHRLAPRF